MFARVGGWASAVAWSDEAGVRSKMRSGTSESQPTRLSPVPGGDVRTTQEFNRRRTQWLTELLGDAEQEV